MTLAIARFLRPGMRCIDVGANYGYYSILMAEAVGPDGFVLACEPNPLLSGTYLPDNLALCGTRTTVEVCPAAISDRVEAEVDFYPHDRDFATASLAPWTHPHHVEPVKCPLTTVDELARDWQRLDLVKIDAEGAELAVWHGMQESLRRFPNAVVVIELHFDRAADLAASFGFDSTDGVLIGDLLPDSPGEKAGLKPGDIVVEFNGERTPDANELRNKVASTAPNSEAELRVFRNGKEMELVVKLGKLEGDTLAASTNAHGSDDLGLEVQTLTAEVAQRLGIDQATTGVVVTSVEPGGIASDAGIRPKDVVLEVDGIAVSNATEFRQEVTRADLEKGLRLRILRDGLKRFLFLRAS